MPRSLNKQEFRCECNTQKYIAYGNSSRSCFTIPPCSQASRSVLSFVMPSASDLIERVREKVAGAGGGAFLDADGDEIELLDPLGQGSFGKVYQVCVL